MMAGKSRRREDYAGNVMGDLSSRRGMVQGMDDMPGGGKVIKAEVPLSEMFGYSTTAAFDVAGPRDLHDGVQALQRGSEERRRRDHHRARRRNPGLRPGAFLPVAGDGGELNHTLAKRSLTRREKWQRANSSGPSRT